MFFFPPRRPDAFTKFHLGVGLVIEFSHDELIEGKGGKLVTILFNMCAITKNNNNSIYRRWYTRRLEREFTKK